MAKSIREMSIKGDEPPPEYLVKETTFGPKHSLSSISSTVSVPIIDISLLSSQYELQKLRSALSTVGCFQAIGHGMSNSFLDKVRQAGKDFFALPEGEKQRYARAVNESEGYGNDVIVSQKQVLDWSYRLTLRVFPRDKRRLSLWPRHPTDFSDILEEFSTQIKSMSDYLLRSMARSLNIEEHSFSSQFGDCSLLQARFNFYPSCSRPDLVLGVKPHTDRSGVTILLQDRDVEGLQILVDDKWVKVPTMPHALLVNLGDQMQIMSNGIFKSVMHRVVTNTEKLRMSVAMFNEPEPENEIGPVDGLVDETRPRLYRNVKNYGFINYKCYQEGKIALDTVMIDENSVQH